MRLLWLPLEIEHIIPKSRGDTDRVSNLTMACHECNQEKGNQTAGEFGHPEVQSMARIPLKDAAAVNVVRWELYRQLTGFNIPVEVGTGGRTKYNRVRMGLPKAHWIDATCVGTSTPDRLILPRQVLKEQAPGFTNAKKGLPQNWYNIGSGRSGFAYATAFKLKGRFGVELYIDTGDKEKNKLYFDQLYEQKKSIEQELGMALSWERLDDARASRIAVYREGSIDASEEELDELQDWVIAQPDQI